METSRISLAGEPGSPPEGDSLGAAVEAAPSPVSPPTGNNGHVDSSPGTVVTPTGPRARKRVEWVEIDDPAYEGFKFRMWINYPQEYDDKIRPNASEDEIREVLNQIFLEHNGWCDFDGNPYPPASDPLFWKKIPNELGGAIVTVIRLEGTKLSNLLMQKQMNTGRTSGRNG
jgi:hypothetical protein